MPQDHKKDNGMWRMFLPIGIGLGTGVGALLGNIGVGMAFGVALGTAFSLLAHDLNGSK